MVGNIYSDEIGMYLWLYVLYLSEVNIFGLFCVGSIRRYFLNCLEYVLIYKLLVVLINVFIVCFIVLNWCFVKKLDL